MTSIYYNFPTTTVSLHGVESASSREIQLSNVGQPLTNIQLNDVNYTAHSIFIASTPSNSNNPGHLIVKCYADIFDTGSNVVFLAIPLVVKPQIDGVPQTESDVDNLIEPPEDGNVVLHLNNYIKKDGSPCVVSDATMFPVTITLDPSGSAIPIKQPMDKTFYNIGNIPNLKVNPNVMKNRNATMQNKELDWIMSCELLYEDGPTEKHAVDPGTTATTITLFMMVIMISCATYIAGPIVYNGVGMFNLANSLMDRNHYTINIYWGLILILLGVMCIVQGIKSDDKIYYFIAISFILSYFSSTSAILQMKGVANPEGSGFDNTDRPFRIFSEIFSSECSSTTGYALKLGVFGLLIYAFLAMVGSMKTGDQTSFVLHVLVFLGVALLQLSAISYFNRKNQ